MRSVGSHNTSEREKEGIKERKGCSGWTINRYLLSMEPWAAAKKALSLFGGINRDFSNQIIK